VEKGTGERIFTGGFGLQGTANDKNHISEICNYFSIKDIWNV